MNSNFHTHTYRCRHAGGTEEDYVKAAISNDLKLLGFSDHGPFKEKEYALRMAWNEVDEYLQEIDRLKEVYSNQIKIFRGFEIEYLPEHQKENFYRYLLEEKHCDYLLLGEHFFIARDGSFQNCYSLNNTEQAIDYALACREGMETGSFRMLAHPDLFMINESFSWDDNCEKASDIIIESAIKNNVILEYNANGVRRGKKQYPDGVRYPYPHDRFWKKLSGTEARTIVGSDCHNPDYIWDQNVIESRKNLINYGFKPIEDIFNEN